MRKSTINFYLIFLVMFMSVSLLFSQDTKKIIYTTTSDLKTDYEIMTVVTAVQEIKSSFSKDPLEVALGNVWEKFMTQAQNIGADAVIGLRYDVSYMTKDLTGKIILYGTAVKFK